jgi:hypothetical protein
MSFSFHRTHDKNKMVLKMFDFFRRHAFIRWASLIGVTMMMLASVMRLSYKEDILDFLPSTRQTGSGWLSMRTSRA